MVLTPWFKDERTTLTALWRGISLKNKIAKETQVNDVLETLCRCTRSTEIALGWTCDWIKY